MSKLFRLGVTAIFAVLLSVSLSQAETINFPLTFETDTLFAPSEDRFALGEGVNVAQFFDVLNIRVGLYGTVEDVPFKRLYMGAGLGLDMPNTVRALGGKWLHDNIGGSVGIMFLSPFDRPKHIKGAVLLAIIRF